MTIKINDHSMEELTQVYSIIINPISCTNQKILVRGSLHFFYSSSYFTEGRTNLCREAIGLKGPIASQGSPYQFL